MVEELVAAAGDAGLVVFAVPGSPLVAERSVELLRVDDRLDVRIEPALSFLDLAWDRLGIDPISSGVRILDASTFGVHAAHDPGPFLVGQCWSKEILSEVKLSADPSPQTVVTVLSRLGLPDERVFEVSWYDLDREVSPDHLTTLFIPVLEPLASAELAKLSELARTLREQCPWDRVQTHRSLRPYLLEEACEVLDAIDDLSDGDGAEEKRAHLAEELGDLLFQVFFHAVLAAEENWFSLADVAEGVHAKLVRRHPHVFDGVPVGSAEEVAENWERIKKGERSTGALAPMDGVPRSLPALAYAAKVIRRGMLATCGGVRLPSSATAEAVLTGVASAMAHGLGASPEGHDMEWWARASGDRSRASGAHSGGDGVAAGGDAVGRDTEREIGDVLLGLCALAVAAGIDPESTLRVAATELGRQLEPEDAGEDADQSS